MAVKERDAEADSGGHDPAQGSQRRTSRLSGGGHEEGQRSLAPVSTSITHTLAMKDAAAAGARAIVMTAFTEDLLTGGGIQADFRKQKAICLEVARRFKEASSVKLTSPGGTSLTMRKEGPKGQWPSIVWWAPGNSPRWPTIEANFSPLKGPPGESLRRHASIPLFGIGVLKEP